MLVAVCFGFVTQVSLLTGTRRCIYYAVILKVFESLAKAFQQAGIRPSEACLPADRLANAE